MRRLLLGLSAAFVLSSLTLASCSDDSFTSTCENTLTCASGSGGADGSGGSAGGSNTGGSSEGGESGCDPKCSGDEPVCDEEATDGPTCVGCLVKDDCAGNPKGALCDTDEKTCVECLEPEDCSEADASRCDAGACKPCEDNDDCTYVDGKGVCDDSNGECVQCLSDDDCGGNPCILNTHTCSAYGKDRETCESCDTDANCAATANLCVPAFYQGVQLDVGYCLEKVRNGCEQPYSVALTGRISLSGVEGESFCGINEDKATCEAVRNLLGGAKCPGNTDAECGEGGLCRTVGALTLRCTYACGSASDCPETGAPSTCDGATGSEYCGGT